MAAVWEVLWGPWQMVALTLELGIWRPGFDVECGPRQELFRCDPAGRGLLGPPASLSLHLIQTHSSPLSTTSEPTQCCSFAQGKGQPNRFFALTLCLFQCFVLEAVHYRRRSEDMKGLRKLGKGQAPLLCVSPVSKQACRK